MTSVVDVFPVPSPCPDSYSIFLCAPARKLTFSGLHQQASLPWLWLQPMEGNSGRDEIKKDKVGVLISLMSSCLYHRGLAVSLYQKQSLSATYTTTATLPRLQYLLFLLPFCPTVPSMRCFLSLIGFPYPCPCCCTMMPY